MASISDIDCCAFAPEIYGKLPKNAISRDYKIMKYKASSTWTHAEHVVEQSGVTKRYGFKHARHCGLL